MRKLKISLVRPEVSPNVAELTKDVTVRRCGIQMVPRLLCSITPLYVLCEQCPLELGNLRSPVWDELKH